jgi:peptidyl-prolyl cis-trans isomerase SurA
MKKFKIFAAVIISVFFFLFGNVSVFAEVLNRIVAIVNSDVITLYELNAKIKQLTGRQPNDLRNQNMEGYLKARRQVLDLLIDEKLARDKIQELGINVSPKEVESAIEKIKKDNNLTDEDLKTSLKKQGLTYESYRKNIKSELEQIRLISFEVKSKIIIEDEEIKEYYEKHKDEFTSKERIHLAAIILTRGNPSNQDKTIPLHRKAEEIILRLKKGEDFGELAKKFSQGPGAQDGGDLGFFKTSQLDPKLLNVIRELPEGGISKPIIRTSEIQIIKVVEKQERKIKPLNELRDAIYGIIFREKVNNQYTSWIKTLRERAYKKILF